MPRHDDISDDELDQVVRSICASHPHTGVSMLQVRPTFTLSEHNVLLFYGFKCTSLKRFAPGFCENHISSAVTPVSIILARGDSGLRHIVGQIQ